MSEKVSQAGDMKWTIVMSFGHDCCRLEEMVDFHEEPVKCKNFTDVFEQTGFILLLNYVGKPCKTFIFKSCSFSIYNSDSFP